MFKLWPYGPHSYGQSHSHHHTPPHNTSLYQPVYGQQLVQPHQLAVQHQNGYGFNQHVQIQANQQWQQPFANTAFAPVPCVWGQAPVPVAGQLQGYEVEGVWYKDDPMEIDGVAAAPAAEPHVVNSVDYGLRNPFHGQLPAAAFGVQHNAPGNSGGYWNDATQGQQHLEPTAFLPPPSSTFEYHQQHRGGFELAAFHQQQQHHQQQYHHHPQQLFIEQLQPGYPLNQYGVALTETMQPAAVSSFQQHPPPSAPIHAAPQHFPSPYAAPQGAMQMHPSTAIVTVSPPTSSLSAFFEKNSDLSTGAAAQRIGVKFLVVKQ
ncbi:hypothetical protein HDU96_004920 [Phlyctochytrium bullatum]|nr:hypothetical protein HDU96_004920 [Phlyctochytrium bullatum]